MGVSRRMKPIILCADDYAQNAAISDAILELVSRGRLSAVSCMTESPLWPSYAKALLPYQGQIDIGLHFNLTEGFPNSTFSLGGLIANSLLRQIPRKALSDALTDQLNRFEDNMGCAPDFVDGHQHVHCFPVVRKILFEVLLKRYAGKLPYLRNAAPPLTGHDAFTKAVVLRILGQGALRGFGFFKEATVAGFPLTGPFLGLYSLRSDVDYPHLFRAWLFNITPGTLIMCHPGNKPQQALDRHDPIADARQNEFSYFCSDAFTRDLNTAHVVLERFAAHPHLIER